MNGVLPSIYLMRTQLPERPAPSGALAASILAPLDFDRFNGFRLAEDKWRLVLGHQLARYGLRKYCGVESPKISRSNRGRPYLAGQDPRSLDFNISHTATWVVCAVARNMAVGVDVVEVEDLADWNTLIEHFLNESETQFLRGLPNHRRTYVAAQFWALKEAVLKAAGYGLEIDPRLIRIEIEPVPRVAVCPKEVVMRSEDICLANIEHAPGSLLTVAVLTPSRCSTGSLAIAERNFETVDLGQLLPRSIFESTAQQN